MNAVMQISPETRTIAETGIIAMARHVEAMIHTAIDALLGPNQELARSILEKEPGVNELETLIDSEILATLNAGTASPQEVREAAAMLKVNKDLERQIGRASCRERV